MLVQHLDRQFNETIIQSKELFSRYEIYDDEEMQLMVRLYKRFFYRTIEKKYGYIKPCDDKVEISGKLLCAELELNPRVLRMFGLITSY